MKKSLGLLWALGTFDSHLCRILSGGAPTGSVTSPDHTPGGGVTKGIQMCSGACREGPAPVGIPQLQSATWQRTTAEIEGKIR